MSLEENKARVRRLVEEAQVKGNLAVVDEILAADFIDHSPLGDLPATREGVHILFAGMRQAFPDLQVVISEQIAEGNRVVTRKSFRGTHRGPFMGVPPSNGPVDFEVIDILTFRDEKIVEHRVVVDRYDLLRQLGAL
jgi:steroid delta-isomerase-like uncharacterized protein